MKKMKLFMAAALIMVGTSASAQSFNAGWNEFTFDLGYGKTYYTGSGSSDDEDIYGFAFNYARGIHLSRSNGLTLRPGVGMLVGYQKVDGRRDDLETTFLSFTPKVDFGYHVTWSNSSISIFPYVGVISRINAWGETKYDGKTYDLFDSDEGDANRFQIGGRVGFDAHFNRFVLGVTYEYDFNEISEDVKIWSTNIKLGWCF